MDVIKKRVPVLSWLPHYKTSYFLKDLLAGFTVALTEIPQGIAYAAVAGLPLQYGLFSGFMGCFMYFIFGTSKDLNIGPTSILSLMIHNYVEYFGPDITGVITLLSGTVIFTLGILNLGFLVEFFSYPVIAGFTSAGALQIAASQFNPLLGLKNKASDFLPAIETVLKNLDKVLWQDTLLGIVSIFLLMITKELFKGTVRMRNRNATQTAMFALFLSRNALIVVMGTTLAYFLRDENNVPIFRITGHIDSGFPPVRFPHFSIDVKNTTTNVVTHYDPKDILTKLGTTTIFLPLVAILETVAIAKAFSKGKTLDGTQEMFAVGICNIMGSFVGSMPVTGSFTRTAVNNASGVKTTFGGVVTGLLVILALGFLTDIFYYIPKASLAAVIICAMIYLVHYESFILTWKSKKTDLIPLLTTFLICLFWSLENGTLIGIATNLAFILYNSARPKFEINEKCTADAKIYLIVPKSNLYFPSAEYLRSVVLKSCPLSNAFVVIDGKNIQNVDTTLSKTFIALHGDLSERNQTLLLLNFKENVQQILKQTDQTLSKCFTDAMDEKIKDYYESSNSTTIVDFQ